LRAIEEVTQIQGATVSTGLVINERKTKYMNRNVRFGDASDDGRTGVCEGVRKLGQVGTLIDSHTTASLRVM
jgi:hypothetical protein